MNRPEERTQSVVVERTFAHTPERLWRALTQPALLTQWLLKTDFAPEIGREFQFRNEPVGGWDGVIECKVLALEPLQRLMFSWRAFGLVSTVEFTLTPAEGGTHLRMEHAGFHTNQEAAYQGAQHGWQMFLGNLERLLVKEDLQ
jgi:uncharacterized protein YndB with AHSA1/START domain